jgi:hypothetical protein
MSSPIITPTSRSLFLDPGPLRPLVEQFGCHLASQGHTVLTVHETVRNLGVTTPLCETDVGPIAPRRQGLG